MEKFITGQEILTQYQLQPFQFLKLINEQGLKPHDPSSGRPWPVLTEPEVWLYRVERVLWTAAGLLLMLFDSAPSVSKLTPEILAQAPHLFHRGLRQLSESKPPGAGLYEFKPERRLPKRKSIRIAAWLLSSILDKNDLTRENPLTAALLQAISRNFDASVFDLADNFSRYGVPTYKESDCLEPEFISDVLSRLLSELDRTSCMEHDLLKNILLESLPVLPLANFCQEYKLKWTGYKRQTIADALRLWPSQANNNGKRLIVLWQISRNIRLSFPSTPLPLKPEDYGSSG